MPTVAPERYTTVLTIAGSDGSGGAGIQADLKTFAALGCYGLSVLTGVTAQNTQGVIRAIPLEPDFITEQCSALADDIEIHAIKIGMLSSSAAVQAIAAFLRSSPSIPVILDTVLRSTGGMELVPPAARDSIIHELFPLATLITPNLPETIELAGLDGIPASKKEIERAAEILRSKGTDAVLIKGGHMTGAVCDDYLLSESKGEWFSSSRVRTINTHGTGCTLSSAIAAFTARGFALHEAVKNGRSYTREALKAGSSFMLGKGTGPLHHFYQWW
ncbi:MAG: bifunctional hydroxymethylpyrimidine kinase/phosphomethylpyrimidine kinase [Chlorobium phaeobacteroides]|uniref:hydroxymethylpyrimidine kinase n=1 Tax=Chlorobium phaeobacteroides (strain BS1) TaxID=331678 RepID=B3EJ12_CHLPB|nr:bifunctional hydroxymethylpyrimidine kinase/phosphomethylpyrimidine kinase [Chlorobium phaeobacteroides]